MAEFFNTGLSQQQFLEQYWQKKPLLIRQALSDFKSLITPEELAGLACEPEIESRLIREHGQDGSWQVTNGPLSEDNFADLPATHWTLLVQDVDKHVPELQSLLDPFRFIPDWRRDDLMISYAPKFGTVGPHTDSYDVFLLQAMGTRCWQITDIPTQEAKFIDGLDLQIMEEFTPNQTWDLQPGDILYLPPHFAHHGVALNECMTYSIGFRAPTHVDILDAVVNNMLEHQLGKARYSDSDLSLAQHSAEIDSNAVVRLKQLLHQTIDEVEPVLATALGKLVTETKADLLNIAVEKMTDLSTIDQISSQFKKGDILQRNLYYRFAWTRSDDKAQLFMAGEAYTATVASISNIIILAEQITLSHDDWLLLKNDVGSTNILCQLISEGGWFWVSNES